MVNISLDIIADYGGFSGRNDLAFLEVKRAFNAVFAEKNISCSDISTMSVRSFNTVETGFAVAQLATRSKLQRHVIFHNTAPRKDDVEVRRNNDGEFLAAALLPSGVIVVGPNSGYSFSFLADVTAIYKLRCPTDGSQFRSRDVFPHAIAILVNEIYENKLTSISETSICEMKLERISPIPDSTIAYIDGYGNIKTTLRSLDQSLFDGAVKVDINGVKETINISKDGIFGIKDGEMVIAQGSSGWQDSRFYEIVMRGGSAAQRFNNPNPGDKVVMTKA